MSERKLIRVACLAGALAASCTPYSEPPANQPQPQQQQPAARQGQAAAQGTVSAEEQQKLQEQRKQAAAEAERKQREAEQTAAGGGGATTPAAGGGDAAATGGEAKPKPTYDFARPVPGKPGFVFSPFNEGVIDVRDIPSGTLVQDPTYPASEKKYFRVP